MELFVLFVIIVVIGLFLSTLKSSPTIHKPKPVIKRGEDPLDLKKGQVGLSVASMFILDEIVDGGGRNTIHQDEKLQQRQEEPILEEDCLEDDFEFFE